MSNSGLPDEQLATLKLLIHEHLRGAGVYESMRAIVSQVVADPAGSGDDQADAAGTDAIIRALQQKGVISDLVASLSAQLEPQGVGRETPSTASPLTLPVLLTGERYLHISLLGGKAFVDHISTARAGAGAVETLSIHAQLGSQRARSRPVAATIDPPFDDSFLFKLAPPAPGGAGGAAGLLSQKSLLHLVLLRSTADGAVREVVGTHLLEWRKVLTVGAAAACTVSVELSGVREEAKLPVGVLDLRLELLPRPTDDEAKALPAERDLLAQLRAERASEADAERAFFAYARAWWHEYVTQRPLHRERLVKIFALSEFGVQRPVTTFVRPIVADRLLESAAHAARFVALLPFERHATVGDGSAESWSTLHSLLVRRKGDVDEHALLLCSLLLGFGCARGTAGPRGRERARLAVLALSLARDCVGAPTAATHHYAALTPQPCPLPFPPLDAIHIHADVDLPVCVRAQPRRLRRRGHRHAGRPPLGDHAAVADAHCLLGVAERPAHRARPQRRRRRRARGALPHGGLRLQPRALLRQRAARRLGADVQL
jgi:centrosomal protein CEP76